MVTVSLYWESAAERDTKDTKDDKDLQNRKGGNDPGILLSLLSLVSFSAAQTPTGSP
jgi:hypothetical protein